MAPPVFEVKPPSVYMFVLSAGPLMFLGVNMNHLSEETVDYI